MGANLVRVCEPSSTSSSGVCMQCCKGMPEINDYGLPLDHPWCPPEERAACDVPLRTAEEHASMGGEILTAAPDAFCTCADDPDPVVAVFEHVINSEDAA